MSATPSSSASARSPGVSGLGRRSLQTFQPFLESGVGGGSAGAGSAGGGSAGGGSAGAGSVEGAIRSASVSRLTQAYRWSMSRALRVTDVHRDGVTGLGVCVAVLDTGIGPHRDLSVTGGINTANHEAPDAWADRHWHGSHVAGILCASGREGGLCGVAPQASLFAVRIGGVDHPSEDRFSNECFEQDLLQALRWCIDSGMDVLNMSIHARRTPALDAMLEEVWAQGIVMVAPTGNRRGSGDPGGVDYPAVHPKVIGVGAVGRLGIYPNVSPFVQAEEGAVYSPAYPDYYVPGFSRTGPGLDLVAPGVAIFSTVPQTLRGFDELEAPVQGYTSWMGTSQAAPFVAGLASLMLEAQPALRALPGGARVEAIRTLLKRSCVPLGLDPSLTGWGIPSAPACLLGALEGLSL